MLYLLKPNINILYNEILTRTEIKLLGIFFRTIITEYTLKLHCFIYVNGDFIFIT